jgi:uncharacterized linocin/CFP29 family protein
LAGRQLVDFSGPHGWDYSSVGLGRTEPIGQPVQGVNAALRRVQTLAELTVPFTLARVEIEAIGRGAEDSDLEAVVEAARAAALAEDRAIFESFAEAGVSGILESAQRQALTLTNDYARYPEVVAAALTRCAKGVSMVRMQLRSDRVVTRVSRRPRTKAAILSWTSSGSSSTVKSFGRPRSTARSCSPRAGATSS